MWRSFFLALGIFSILLGAQTLVVDHFVTADARRMPRFLVPRNNPVNPVAYEGYTGGAYQGGFPAGQNSVGQNTVAQRPSPYSQSGGFATNPTGSSSVSSRFQGGQLPNYDPALHDRSYASGPTGFSQQAGYQSPPRYGTQPNFQLASYGNDPAYYTPNSQSSFRKRVYKTKDWMPWSLIAFGIVVVLYTSSMSRRHSEE